MMYANVGAVRKVIGNVSFCSAGYKVHRLSWGLNYFYRLLSALTVEISLSHKI